MRQILDERDTSLSSQLLQAPLKRASRIKIQVSPAVYNLDNTPTQGFFLHGLCLAHVPGTSRAQRLL